MSKRHLDRRQFAGCLGAAALTAPLAHAVPAAQQAKRAPVQPARRSILNFNESMDYRRLGRSGLWVSAACMGGHWKRVETMLSGPFKGVGYAKQDYENVNNPEFIKNRHEVVSRAIEVGINYIDACAGPEVLAYSKVLKGRRDKMYLGFSWFEREPRFKEWRSKGKLIDGLDQSLKEAGLEYVDLWRITLPEQNVADQGELKMIEEATAEALMLAKKQGKARLGGVSTHNRVWLNWLIEQYTDVMDVVLTPYTPSTRELPSDSMFDAIRKHDIGMFGIKPFGSNALFAGDSSLRSQHKADDDRKARLALRYVLANPSVTAPIPGLANIDQVNNVAAAIMERRKLDPKEKAELEKAASDMWARMDPSYHWLKDWQWV
jgi:aryl-alcohol dehydrogenase-like predicted oxidoreductase